MFTLDYNLDKLRNTNNEINIDLSRRTKILIIDDNEDFVAFFKMILSHLGYAALGAYNGESGIALSKYLKPEVIFCDTELPDMRGCQVAEAIKLEYPALTIALSEKFEEADTEDGCYDLFVTKPIRTSILDTIFSNAFKTTRAS